MVRAGISNMRPSANYGLKWKKLSFEFAPWLLWTIVPVALKANHVASSNGKYSHKRYSNFGGEKE